MATWSAFAREAPDIAALAERRMGWRPAPGTFHVFLVDLLGPSSARMKDDVMVVEAWKPGEGVTVTEKRE
jgi:hypothetical protein